MIVQSLNIGVGYDMYVCSVNVITLPSTIWSTLNDTSRGAIIGVSTMKVHVIITIIVSNKYTEGNNHPSPVNLKPLTL